jgi:hypothetical protein
MREMNDHSVPPRQVRPHTPGPGYHCARCDAPHLAGCVGGNAGDGPCPMRAQTRATADAMKAGAETANLRTTVAGLDGAGWAAKIEKLPMCTLPPGAGALVVKYFSERELQLRSALTLIGALTHFNGGDDGDLNDFNALIEHIRTACCNYTPCDPAGSEHSWHGPADLCPKNGDPCVCGEQIWFEPEDDQLEVPAP